MFIKGFFLVILMFTKKETAKVFAVMLLSVFMFSLIAGVLVAGQTTPAPSESKTLSELFSVNNLKESLVSLFTLEKIADLNTRNAIAKFLLTILLILLVYSVADFMPFFPEGKEWIKWAVAFVVAILAFIFVKDVSAITKILYEPMGIAIVSIIPLIVVIAFTLKMRDKSPQMAFIVNKIVIILFVLMMLINAVRGMLNGQGLAWIYLVTAIVGGIWMYAERSVWAKLFEYRVQGFIEQGFMLSDAQKLAKIQTLREQADTLDGMGNRDAAKRLRSEATNLEKTVGKKEE